MNPQAPDLPVFKSTRQVRVRGAGRIERDAVVFDGADQVVALSFSRNRLPLKI